MAKLSELQNFVSNPENMRLYQQERIILEATCSLSEEMDKQGVSHLHLANLTGRTEKQILSILEGEFTIRKLSDVFLALGVTISLEVITISQTI